MLIAVATKAGQEVDLHFGKASAFTVFQVDRQGIRRLKEVAVARYCTGDPDHTFHKQRFSAIAEALGDCRAVVCVQVGDLPRLTLAEAGIQTFIAQGDVEQALRNAYSVLSAGE